MRNSNNDKYLVFRSRTYSDEMHIYYNIHASVEGVPFKIKMKICNQGLFK